MSQTHRNDKITWIEPTRGEISGTIEFRGHTLRTRHDQEGDMAVARIWLDGNSASKASRLKSGEEVLLQLVTERLKINRNSCRF